MFRTFSWTGWYNPVFILLEDRRPGASSIAGRSCREVLKQRSRVDPRLARSRAQYETSGLGLYQQTLAREEAQHINLPGVRKSVKSYFLIDLYRRAPIGPRDAPLPRSR